MSRALVFENRALSQVAELLLSCGSAYADPLNLKSTPRVELDVNKTKENSPLFRKGPSTKDIRFFLAIF